jgi:hypothetical protein
MRAAAPIGGDGCRPRPARVSPGESLCCSAEMGKGLGSGLARDKAAPGPAGRKSRAAQTTS